MPIKKCGNCGNEIINEFLVCPACKQPVIKKKAVSIVKGCLGQISLVICLIILLMLFRAFIGSNDNKEMEITNKEDTRIIKEAEYYKWPFNVKEGKLYCIDSAVIFEVNNNKYALNGIAADRGYNDIKAIVKLNQEIVGLKEKLANEQGKSIAEVEKTVGPTPHMDIGLILNDGLNLCSR